jgi:hypothetical protein
VFVELDDVFECDERDVEKYAGILDTDLIGMYFNVNAFKAKLDITMTTNRHSVSCSERLWTNKPRAQFFARVVLLLQHCRGRE